MVFAFLLLGTEALAQYRPPPAPKEEPPEEDTFEEAVDLRRFRKGRIDWDTQELITSGLTALHRENQKILEALAALRTKQDQLIKEISHLKETLERIEKKP